jgi:hypothetical protein
MQAGDVFSSGELNSALDRVQRKWPFVRADRKRRPASAVPVLRLDERDGGIRFRSEQPLEAAPPPPPSDDDERDDWWKDWDRDWDEDHIGWKKIERNVEKQVARNLGRWGWYTLEGDTVVVYLRTEPARARGQWQELIRHTPVTGFAPGLAGTLTLYDPGDRVHLMLDGAVNINTRRQSLDATGETFLQRLSAQQRVDWLLGPRIRLPGLDVAELGGQIHTLTDTADKWRISAIDSYLYSALLNRADREYYRRTGVAGFLTLHLFEELTLGGEYRFDRYDALDIPHGIWSVFNNGDPRYGAAAVDEGEMGSVVGRLEYHSDDTPLHKVGSMWRNSEISLVAGEPRPLGLSTVNTLEVADPKLGGAFKFTRFVSDTSVTMEAGRHDTVTLRLRGAGGHDLPLQKQEGLGGWEALRGYDFKEFRGNASLLATLQLEGRHLGAFVDVGSVHQAGIGWIDPKPAAGAFFAFADGSTRAEAAWRLDGHARLVPEFRILFSVPR